MVVTMAHELRSASIVAVTNAILFAGSAAFGVYNLGQYNLAWGPDRSWQVLWWLALASSALAFFGALFGSILASRTGRSLHPRHAVLAGMLVAAVLWILVYLKHAFAMEGGLFGAVVGSLVLPYLVCVKMSKPDDDAADEMAESVRMD